MQEVKTLTPEMDEEALLADLAQLSPVAYDHRREEAARLLRCRVQSLDQEVARRRPKPQNDAQGSPMLFEDPAPWPDPVNGTALLDELAALFTRFVYLPDGGAVTLALWVLHTHTHEAAQISPILCLTSPQKRCGKTTVLALLRAVVARPLPAANITAAALFRATELWRPTLLIDEADSFLRDNEELRGVLNSGHMRDTAYVVRTVGDEHEPRAFATWAPKVIALIGALPPTLADRSIVLPMRRKLPTEPTERLRLDRLTGYTDLRRRCVRWAADHLEALKTADPPMPVELHDRAADNWRPLCAIADAAGGDWPARVRAAMQALASQFEDDTAGILLLEDMQTLFTERDRLLTVDLLKALHEREDRPWPEWSHGEPITPRQIARLLAPFGIRPKTIRTDTDRGKGYLLKDCLDAFARYLGDRSVTPCQASNDADFQDFRSVTPPAHVTDKKSRNPALDNGCHGVTDQKGGIWKEEA